MNQIFKLEGHLFIGLFVKRCWQIERQAEDVGMLRKALFELAYVAEENGIYLSNLTKSTQDTIVAMRLGGFK